MTIRLAGGQVEAAAARPPTPSRPGRPPLDLGRHGLDELADTVHGLARARAVRAHLPQSVLQRGALAPVGRQQPRIGPVQQQAVAGDGEIVDACLQGQQLGHLVLFHADLAHAVHRQPDQDRQPEQAGDDAGDGEVDQFHGRDSGSARSAGTPTLAGSSARRAVASTRSSTSIASRGPSVARAPGPVDLLLQGREDRPLEIELVVQRLPVAAQDGLVDAGAAGVDGDGRVRVAVDATRSRRGRRRAWRGSARALRALSRGWSPAPTWRCRRCCPGNCGTARPRAARSRDSQGSQTTAASTSRLSSASETRATG
ncbi:MAG: hypothetical protein U5K33_09360 [Halofilum sp. (in: g-proteobacteria)]|nr:hypothetical protein [Halofilum sp. (in: g-proteobacteria)]